MSMRYIIRRPKAEDFSEIKTKVPDLDAQLGTAAADLRREVLITHSAHRTSQYFFQTKKVGAAWVWTCPTLEVVAENEKGIFQMTKMYNVPKPSHLAHLPE